MRLPLSKQLRQIPALVSLLRKACFEYAGKFVSTGAVHFFSAQIFSQVLSFGSSILVVKFLTPAELAESRIIQTYAGYIVMLGGMGFGASILTVFPKERDEATKAAWLRALAGFAIAATSVLAMGAAVISFNGGLMSNAKTAYWFRWFLLGTLANVLASLLTAFYQAGKQVKKLSGIQSVVRFFNVFLIVGAAWTAGFAGYIIAATASAWVYALSLYKATKWESIRLTVPQLPKVVWSTGLLAMGGNLLYSMSRSLDIVIMDRLVTDRALMGSFALASSFMMFPQFLISAVQTVGVPYFAARFREPQWLLKTTIKAQAVALLLSFVIAALFYLGCLALVHWFYGPSYAPTARLIVPMLGAFCLNSTFNVLSMALFAIDMVRINVLVAVIMFPISVAMSYGCIRQFGVAGAVWAQLANAFLYALVQHGIGWRVMLNQRKRIFPTAA